MRSGAELSLRAGILSFFCILGLFYGKCGSLKAATGLCPGQSHYYPFGLTMAGISSKAAGGIQNKEKTFQGQQFDDDLGLNWIQFRYRNHDPQIGRFLEIDPLSEKYVYNSVYAFSENKVTTHIELEGLEGIRFDDVDANGKLQRINIEKNIVVLLDQTSHNNSKKKNQKIEKANQRKMQAVGRELNSLFNGGRGSRNSEGVSVVFTFNIIGVTDNVKDIKSKTERDRTYSQISAGNSLMGQTEIAGPQDNGIATLQDRPVGAAVITNDRPEGFENEGEARSGGIIRASKGYGVIAHEVIHALDVGDNGYDKGGLLGRYPSKITTEEVDQIIKQSVRRKN